MVLNSLQCLGIIAVILSTMQLIYLFYTHERLLLPFHPLFLDASLLFSGLLTLASIFLFYTKTDTFKEVFIASVLSPRNSEK